MTPAEQLVDLAARRRKRTRMKMVSAAVTWICLLVLSALAMLALIALLSGCTTKVPDQATETKTQTSVETRTSSNTIPPTGLKAAWPNVEWTRILVAALDDLGPALMSSYPEGVCGDRRQFYVMLFSEMVRYESSFNPRASYTEAFPDSKGNPQVSRGLLQLSFDDAKNNGKGCDFKTVEDVYDVRLNLRCGVRILNRWVERDGTVAAGSSKADAKGGARYWSVLRTGKKKDAIMKAARGTCQ